MIKQIKKFLSNEMSTFEDIDAVLDYRDFSDVLFFVSNLSWDLNDYIKLIEAEQKETVVIIFYDHFKYDNLANGDYCNVSKSMRDIIEVVNTYASKAFVLVTCNIYTEDEIAHIKPTNLKIIETSYMIYEAITIGLTWNNPIDKDFNKEWHVICLNNNPRPHRIGVLLYLNALGIKSVYSTFISKERWEKGVEYTYETILSHLYPYSKLYDKMNIISLENIYKHNAEYVFADDNDTNYETLLQILPSQNCDDNFINKLLPLYKSAAVEIITESTALEETAMLCEKFVHTIIGECFPIIIGTRRNVEIYRNLGYDMFDDVIDHSYDYEPNPFYRLKMAIDANIDILTNKDLAISLYAQNKERFENNINNYKKQYNKTLGHVLRELDYMI